MLCLGFIKGWIHKKNTAPYKDLDSIVLFCWACFIERQFFIIEWNEFFSLVLLMSFFYSGKCWYGKKFSYGILFAWFELHLAQNFTKNWVYLLPFVKARRWTLPGDIQFSKKKIRKPMYSKITIICHNISFYQNRKKTLWLFHGNHDLF